jgi:hypothetical protein
MLRKPLLLLLFAGLVASSQAGIDLTPQVTDVVEDGVTSREVSFKTPEGKVLLTLSPGWAIRGQKQRAQITGKDQATEAVIEAVPIEKPEPLNDEAIAKFKQQVVAGLPAGSAKVTTISEAANSLMPGGNPSFEFVITYDLWGKVFQRSALLVNGPHDRLVFRFTSVQQDFSNLNTQFRRIAMTWRAIETKQPPGTQVADAGTPPRTAN